ncbi:GH18112 [Drosophila grimshawi]|uniref:GH18112 n=2 Tax=Drosophila grimshawi TaxID=7222 RepID=B4JGY5_DROGR|nr:GH18112 [Drosophila grimshawi]
MPVQCRTCASVIYNMNAKNLFEIENSEILMSIKLVAGTTLERRPDLPSHICACCMLDLKVAAYRMKVFRDRCIKTQEELLSCSSRLEQPFEEEYSDIGYDDEAKQELDTDYDELPIAIDKLEENEVSDVEDDELIEFEEDNNNPTDMESDLNEDTSEDVDSLIKSVQNEIDNICRYSSDSQETLEDFRELSDNDDDCMDLFTDTTNPTIFNNVPNKTIHQKTNRRPNRKKCKQLSTESNSDAAGHDSNTIHRVKKTYTSWKNLTEEEIVERRRQRRRGDYVCDQCGRHFNDQSNFKLHLLRHSGVKNFKCGQCSKLYYTEHLLQLHERIVHQGERPYACKYCDKTFNSSTTRVMHERSHTNTRPYSCDYCGKSFISASGLKRHDLTHNGVRPYYCSICDKSFQRNTHLKAHLRSKLHASRETNIGL